MSGPAWSKTLASRESSGPRREGDEPKPAMHEGEESDPATVAVKRANEAGRPAEEFVEPRAGAKENAQQDGTPRTPSRQAVRFAANIQGGSRMRARPVLCGGRSAMGVPTAIVHIFCFLAVASSGA